MDRKWWKPKEDFIPRHATYMGNTLLTYNSNFSKEAEKIADDWANGRNQNDATANKFRSYVNSAPANLRYGDPKQNSAIGKFVDPMGDQNQKMTPKEKQWHIMFDDLQCKKADSNWTICTECNCNNACQTSSASTDNINYYVCM